MENAAGSDGRDPLAIDRAINRICDRFEQAWAAGDRPDLKSYLEELPPDNQPPLFLALLRAELALREDGNESFTRDEYLHRFPRYRAIVAGAFAGEPSEVILRFDPAHAELVRVVRARLRAGALKSDGRVDANAPTIGGDPPAEPSADEACTSPGELWELLLRRVARRPAEGAASAGSSPVATELEAVTRQLIGAFPATRGRILTSLLLGSGVPAAAHLHHVTERTITMTSRTATDLLRSSLSSDGREST